MGCLWLLLKICFFALVAGIGVLVVCGLFGDALLTIYDFFVGLGSMVFVGLAFWCWFKVLVYTFTGSWTDR